MVERVVPNALFDAVRGLTSSALGTTRATIKASTFLNLKVESVGRFGDSYQSMHYWASWIVGDCWMAFLAFWIVSAIRVKAVKQRESPLALLYRVLAEIVGFSTLFWSDNLPWLAPRIIPHTAVSDSIGILGALGGLAVAIWARVTLAGNWSASITLKEDHELIQSGPYCWVRHPIYTGILLLIVAEIAVVGRRGSLLGGAILLLAFWRKWRTEERLMESHFGSSYLTYRKQTGAVIPGL